MTEQRLYGADGGPRKPARFSQCSKIMRVLEDGKPHLVSEIHALAGYSRLNSRVSELRKRGYDIQSYHLPGKSGSEGYGYQLISQDCTDGADPPRVAETCLMPVPSVQLSLTEAA